ADISLSIRLLTALFKKLPGFFPDDLKPLMEKWYKEVQEKEKKKEEEKDKGKDWEIGLEN
ncbi:MAG: hypothetical protein RMJ34_07435, partial [candidate division WOR-3 bacterium]|nr:hypothetical protein [candidate division WOR-3 bacterium]